LTQPPLIEHWLEFDDKMKRHEYEKHSGVFARFFCRCMPFSFFFEEISVHLKRIKGKDSRTWEGGFWALNWCPV